MAVALDKLIDLNLLSHYDSNLKSWVEEQIAEGKGIETSGELPEQGEEGKVYITEDGIFIWSDGEYKAVSSSAKLQWTKF